jgi:hypothetical protein
LSVEVEIEPDASEPTFRHDNNSFRRLACASCGGKDFWIAQDEDGSYRTIGACINRLCQKFRAWGEVHSG